MIRALMVAAAFTMLFERSAEARYEPALLDAPLVSVAARILADRVIIIESTPRVPMEPPPAKWAMCWNLFIPGLGQVVLGKPLRGLLFFLGTVAGAAIAGSVLGRRDGRPITSADAPQLIGGYALMLGCSWDGHAAAAASASAATASLSATTTTRASGPCSRGTGSRTSC